VPATRCPSTRTSAPLQDLQLLQAISYEAMVARWDAQRFPKELTGWENGLYVAYPHPGGLDDKA